MMQPAHRFRAHLIAVLPVGAIEQHGRHLPLSVHQVLPDGMIAATLPPVPPLSAPTLMWMEAGASLAAAGVRVLVLLTSDGGQIPVMDIVARGLRVRYGLLTVAANRVAMGTPDSLLTAAEQRFEIHAGEMETPVMPALHPDLVTMGQARDFRSVAQDMARDNLHLGWQAQDPNAGACGNAAIATTEQEHAVLDHAGRQIATRLQEVHRAPRAMLDRPANSGAFS